MLCKNVFDISFFPKRQYESKIWIKSDSMKVAGKNIIQIGEYIMM